jgi:hypothetical protein
MNKKYNNRYYKLDGQHTINDKNLDKPKRKAKGKSYTILVLEYLRDEWGLQSSHLTDEAIEFLADMIEVEYQGDNVPNSAALVVEAIKRMNDTY